MKDESALRATVAELRRATRLRVLPPRVAAFQWRAGRLARRLDDRFTLVSATRPADLAKLLELAVGRHRVAELGTATGWTAISFALADPERQVLTYDPSDRPERIRYLDLVDSRVRARVQFFGARGVVGPPDRQPIDLLYIDSSHRRDETIAEVKAWRSALAPGGLVIFDDYTHALYPGVREAIEALGLDGKQQGTLFVHETARGGDVSGQAPGGTAPAG
jgi:predicted O-methyltransferase YrrM